ncbi:MAG: hypothetical protein AB7E04_04835 [Desulfobacteraceae bacterium]|jgi:hypothetical protein
MKKILSGLILLLFFCLFSHAGEFDPEAGTNGSLAVKNDDEKILNWADSYYDYMPGKNLDEIWKDPSKALGFASGEISDIVSLGEGGEITLGFFPPVQDKEGFDFAVFENSFSDRFLELAEVFVSTNGIDFVGFDTFSNTSSFVSSYGTVDPEDIKNFAGKYRKGYGTCFDLAELENHPLAVSGVLDLNEINYIKIKDIIGDGRVTDSRGNPVYDPYPTYGSAGFDLDGACSLDGLVISFTPDDDNQEESPEYSGEGFGNEGGCFIGILLD